MASAAHRTATSGRANARQSFAEWLIAQAGQKGLIGMLAAAAAADRGFPKTGDVEQARARLIMNQADGDMFEALDDAELLWPGR